MTGSPTQVEPRIGGRYTAWKEYISGITLELQPFRLIVRSWRTTEFLEDAPTRAWKSGWMRKTGA